MAVTYEFRCKLCGKKYETQIYGHMPICCDTTTTRQYGFFIRPGFQEHYNNSVDMYVPNRRILGDAFKVASDDMTNYTGIEHRFVERDPMDHEAFGLTTDDVQSAREYQDRLDTDGRVDKGSSPFKPKDKLILPDAH